MIYCVLPVDLAVDLHDCLRHHFRADSNVDVIVERRRNERRGHWERRISWRKPGAERRAVRNLAGRRVGERRAVAAALTPLRLPAKARPFAARIRFVEVLEPSGLEAEDIDTQRLVTRFQAGDRQAFETIYTRYFDRVYAYLRVALRSAHEAEDAAQQVFLMALEALARYEPRPGIPFRAWLFVIVRRHAISRLRARGWVEAVDPSDLAQQEPSERETDLPGLSWLSDRELLLFVERLPVPQQQVLVLRFMLDLRSQEIAEILGISADNVRVLQHRALGFLRLRLGAVHFDSGRGRRERARGLITKSAVLRTRRFALAYYAGARR